MVFVDGVPCFMLLLPPGADLILIWCCCVCRVDIVLLSFLLVAVLSMHYDLTLSYSRPLYHIVAWI
jgi:hypothetical protein